MKGKCFKRNARKSMLWMLILCLMCMTLTIVVFAEPEEEISVAFTEGRMEYTVNEETLESDVAPYIDNGRIMIPLVHAARALGARVEWNAEERKASVMQQGDVIEITIGSAFLMKNGEYFDTMDSLPVIFSTGDGLGRTMLPVSRLARVLDVEYEWDEETRTATFLPPELPEVMEPEIEEEPEEELPVPEIITESGTYGPEEGILEIDYDILVQTENVRLENLEVSGTITLESSRSSLQLSGSYYQVDITGHSSLITLTPETQVHQITVYVGATGTSLVLQTDSYLNTLLHEETVTTRGSGTIENQY